MNVTCEEVQLSISRSYTVAYWGRSNTSPRPATGNSLPLLCPDCPVCPVQLKVHHRGYRLRLTRDDELLYQITHHVALDCDHVPVNLSVRQDVLLLKEHAEMGRTVQGERRSGILGPRDLDVEHCALHARLHNLRLEGRHLHGRVGHELGDHRLHLRPNECNRGSIQVPELLDLDDVVRVRLDGLNHRHEVILHIPDARTGLYLDAKPLE